MTLLAPYQKLFNAAATVCASLAIGVLAWSSTLPWFSVAACGLVIVLWSAATNRSQALLSTLAYWLFASRDAPTVIERYTGSSYLLCALMVLAYCAGVAGLYALAWSAQPARRRAGLIVVSALMLMPPLGGLFWASPMLAAGVLFPGTGLLGLGLLLSLWLAVDGLLQRRTLLNTGWVCALLAGAALMQMRTEPKPPVDVLAMQTKLPRYPSSDLGQRYAYQLQLTELATQALQTNAAIVVMPEEIAGVREARFNWLWEDVDRQYREHGKTLFIGADTRAQGGIYYNTLLVMGQTQAITKASLPVPIGSWHPWDQRLHFPASWFEAAHVQVLDRHFNVFFCYEELVPWPWIWSALANPAPYAAVTVVNHWFATDLSLTDSQLRSARSWSRLFGWPLVRSVNAGQG